MVERYQEVLATDPAATRATFIVAAGAPPSTGSPPDCLPAAIFRNASDAWLLADRRASVVRVNAAAAALLGSDLAGRPLADVIAGDPDDGVADAIIGAVRHGTTGSAQVRLSCCGRWHLAIAFPHEDGVAVLLHDVHDHREAEARARFAALTDALTGLPNRPALYDCLRGLLGRRDTSVSALFIDLDRFKRVNDSFGHEAGDELLREASRRLRDNADERDFVARISGDEFVFATTRPPDALEALASRLLMALSAPLVIQGFEVSVGGSIGIATADAADSIPDLLRKADLAMYLAKTTGRNRYRVYSRAIALGARERVQTETLLRRAVRRHKLDLWVQPKFRADTGGMVDCEVLVRWPHPERGLLLPEEFIGVAADSSLIIELGDFVLEEAVRRLSRWRRDGAPDLCLSVNVHERQLLDDGFVRHVDSVLRRWGVPAVALGLEISERSFITDPRRAHDVIRDAASLGLRISIDDFGSGYFNLVSLRELPIRRLQLDRALVSRLQGDAASREVVVAAVAMAHAMGIEVLAKGVENEAQLAWLRDQRCDGIQGFLTARPMPVSALPEFLAAERARREVAAPVLPLATTR